MGLTRAYLYAARGAIERIEVIRGPASTIYGSDAVGGVVNIITKKHVDQFTGTISIDRTQFQNDDRLTAIAGDGRFSRYSA